MQHAWTQCLQSHLVSCVVGLLRLLDYDASLYVCLLDHYTDINDRKVHANTGMHWYCTCMFYFTIYAFTMFGFFCIYSIWLETKSSVYGVYGCFLWLSDDTDVM